MKCLHNHQRAAKVLTIALMMTVLTQAQNPTSVERQQSGFYGYFGLGIGCLTGQPDVEDNTNEPLALKSTTLAQDMAIEPDIEMGVGDIIHYFDLEAGVAYRYYQIETYGSLEFATGNYGYSFTRTSPMLGGNFYIPLGKPGKHAMYFGSAFNYNFVNADVFNDSNWGYRLQYGFSFQYGEWDLQPYLIYNSCKLSDNYNGQNLNINFSSIQIGVLLSWHSIIYFKD